VKAGFGLDLGRQRRAELEPELGQERRILRCGRADPGWRCGSAWARDAGVVHERLRSGLARGGAADGQPAHEEASRASGIREYRAAAQVVKRCQPDAGDASDEILSFSPWMPRG
jgi:hypothetical protein